MTAIGHPLRRQILRVFLEQPAQPLSASEMARATKQPLARVSYHLRTLAACGLLQPQQAQRENGAGGRSPSWSLEVEGDWLRLMLELWAQSGLPR
jgi:predicted transcriptional regulator